MSFKDWISFLIKKWIWYMETPRQERKALKAGNQEMWTVRWFGMLPFSIKMAIDKQRARLRRRVGEK